MTATAVGLALSATHLYRVLELLAALLIFSVAFIILGTIFLIFFLIDELAFKGVLEIEAGVARVRARHATALSQRYGNRLLNGGS
jgi:hypothetical protein